MKYFIDTEFIEGAKTCSTSSIKARRKTANMLFALKDKDRETIDLISIGIAAEDGRRLYMISKDFDLYEAWNRADGDTHWLRDNVLKVIWDSRPIEQFEEEFNYVNFKSYIEQIGYTKEQIKSEVVRFTRPSKHGDPKFYGYYCDYDWVVFCWLFGRMISLPEYFPMYCIDLKQIGDMFEKNSEGFYEVYNPNKGKVGLVKDLKLHPNYPVNLSEHSAIEDAVSAMELYKFYTKVKSKLII